MRSTGRYEAAVEYDPDHELNEEVDTSKEMLEKYFRNIDSLLGKERSKEVKKAMVNYIVEQL